MPARWGTAHGALLLYHSLLSFVLVAHNRRCTLSSREVSCSIYSLSTQQTNQNHSPQRNATHHGVRLLGTHQKEAKVKG